MSIKVTKVFAVFSLMTATCSVAGSDSLQGLPGIYKLTGVNDSKLPAVSRINPGEKCKEEVLTATMLIGAENRWAVLLEDRKICAEGSEKESPGMVKSTVFTGTYKVSGNIIEFHDEKLDLTDHASFENDVLRYTVIGIGDYDGQTDVYVFHKDR